MGPDWKMNPGKLIGLPGKTPNKLDDNLRLGAELRSLATAKRIFSFPPIAAASRTPRCAAWVSASAAAKMKKVA